MPSVTNYNPHLPTDMKNSEYNLVTLEELEALYEKAEGLRKDIKMPVSVMNTALEKHLFAERMLQMDFNDDNWTCTFPNDIIEYAKLWMRPLVWTDPFNFKDLLIEGRVAVEELYPDIDDRYIKIRDIVDNVYKQAILMFADTPSVNEFNDAENGIIKGMHNWHIITKDYKSLLDKILVGEFNDDEDEDEEDALKYYDSFRLQCNLTLIAEERSPKRAAELLHMLRDEWPKIKRWKIGLDTMTEEEIAEFEQELMNGFNVLLDEWENDQPTAAQKTIKSQNQQPFKYIHYSVTDEQEREHVHKEICNIVQLPKMSQVCNELCTMMKNQRILSSIDRTCMLEELRRLGLPDANTPGFSDQNFYSYYHTK